MRPVLVILLFLICPLLFNAQGNLPPGTYTSTNKKAIKLLEEAKKYYETRQDSKAEDYFLKTIKEDPNFVEAHIGLGYLYMEQNKNVEAVGHFRKAIEINPKFFPRNFLDCGMAELSIADYEGAKKHLEEYMKFDRVSPESKNMANFYLEKAKFAIEAMKKPVPFNPVNVGQEINSENGEYFPSLTGDGKTFMFTRSFRGPDGGGQEDFYVSRKDNSGKWQPALPLQGINSSGNEGAPTISADGNYMFFAACEEMPGVYLGGNSQGFGSCDIFYAQKLNGKWTKPVNVGGPINTGHWETQPSFSSDGKTLYFIRGVAGRDGNKTVDIYMSELNNGKFGAPVKLPETVNTPHEEESVFIHPDNQTLYFSSDGHPGMGGQDIFMSKRQPDGSWGKAVNLGYPINTQTDENSLLVDPAGQLAYFASDRKGGFGDLDIYQFELPKEVRPEKLTYVKGKVYNAVTKEPLEARFELYDLETQKNVTQSYSDKAGQFLVTLTASKNYIVNVNRDGYLFYSDNFSLKGKETDFNKPFLLDIPLQPIDTGSTVELKNVFFDVNKWDLKPESKAELEKLIAFLSKNPTVKIELGGHTDNSGDKAFNKTLSENRAKAVFSYVVMNGKIDPKRITYKGYADTRPKVPNDSPENKAKNRRTEFKVIAK
jgi:outer membrane protein OmpA-like peptidoglycan-associated protein